MGVITAVGAGALLAMPAAGAVPAMRTVSYHGVTVRVPSNWPVIDLGRHPDTCVRFDRHALYLGTPGAAQSCPSGIIGRTEAMLIAPTAAPGGSAVLPGIAPGFSAIVRVPGAGVRITTTWATSRTDVVRILGREAASTAQAPAASAGAAPRGSITAAAIRNATPVTGSALGFDTCSAPALSTMTGWLSSPYRTVGVYIGGVNSACAQPNLTASWVQAVTAAGWRLIPTYVGLQAAGACGCASITPASAHLQGVQAANDAVAKAKTLGIPAGNPIYDDMEGYTSTTANRAAVLAFVSGWTSQLHVAGFTAGVYSSGGSGITDLVNAAGGATTEPDELWIANWNGLKTASDPYVPAGLWSNHQRLRQYSGGHTERYGGVALDIDSDYVDGATASGLGFPPPDGSFVTYGGRTFRMAGGAPLQVTNWSTVGGAQGALALTAAQWRSLRRLPADGTLVSTATDGRIYEIVGGAPLLVTGWAAIGGQRASVQIDPWDLANTANPMAHLRGTPADGTFITAGPGGSIYRIAGDAAFAVSSWTVVGGAQPAVTVDPWDLLHPANPRARLRARPVTGTVVTAIRARSYWRFANGYRTKVTAVVGAVSVDDTGLAAYPALPVCVVPRLAGATVGQARALLAAGHCALGSVIRQGSAWRIRTPHVTAQGAPVGARRQMGSAVAITIR